MRMYLLKVPCMSSFSSLRLSPLKAILDSDTALIATLTPHFIEATAYLYWPFITQYSTIIPHNPRDTTVYNTIERIFKTYNSYTAGCIDCGACSIIVYTVFDVLVMCFGTLLFTLWIMIAHMSKGWVTQKASSILERWRGLLYGTTILQL